jgi:hypothetical protein
MAIMPAEFRAALNAKSSLLRIVEAWLAASPWIFSLLLRSRISSVDFETRALVLDEA